LRAAREVGADEQFLDALVLVAEAFFEAQHALADDREAEVARLDDAGVDGADRDFVGALAADLDEVVVGRRVGEAAGRQRGVVAQRIPAGGPAAMAQPGALVAALAGDADHVARGALHAVGGGEDGGQVGVTRGVFRQVERQPGMALVDAEDALQAETVPHSLALVAAPDRGDAPAGEVHRGGETAQILTARRMAVPHRRAGPGLAREFDGGVVEKEHVQLSMRAASWNQRVR
jgi:hypothetical protein